MLFRSIAFFLFAWLIASPGAFRSANRSNERELAASTPSSGTVPIDLRDNRVFVNLTLARADGSLRKARFQVDSGGGAVILSESLSRDLRLKTTGPASKEEGQSLQPVTTPEIRIGEMPLDLTGVPVIIAVGSKNEFMPGSGAEGFLPARVLRKYEVVFDYPGREFTMAQPGVLKPRGVAVPSPVGEHSGFPRIEMTIAGEKYGFLLDTGAAYTMISQALLTKWRTAHPQWPTCIGAAGAANMIGGSFDAKAEMLRIPEIQWGTFTLRDVGVVSRPEGTFEKYMSQMMSAPIVGSIAGNVLRAFRVQIDYAHGVTYLEKGASINAHDLDAVGIVVGAHPDGSYTIGGVVKHDGKEAVEGVNAGDKLLRIGDWEVQGQTLADVLRALRGKPGETRTLLLERDGKQLTVTATVVSLL